MEEDGGGDPSGGTFPLEWRVGQDCISGGEDDVHLMCTIIRPVIRCRRRRRVSRWSFLFTEKLELRKEGPPLNLFPAIHSSFACHTVTHDSMMEKGGEKDSCVPLTHSH